MIRVAEILLLAMGLALFVSYSAYADSDPYVAQQGVTSSELSAYGLLGPTYTTQGITTSSTIDYSYSYVTQWGDTRPDLNTQLVKPRGVAVDSAGNVYVSQVTWYSSRITKYSSSGSYIKYWTACNGTPLDYPMEMAMDSSDNLYVVDRFNNRICVYNTNGSTLRVITGSFNGPLGVAVDDSGYVYVTDRGNNAVKKFNSSGTLINTWTGFSDPWGITFYNGYIYVTQDNGNIKKYTTGGTLEKTWGSRGTGAGQFHMAEGIVGFNSLIYVADGEYGRIQVFDTDGNFQYAIGERGTGDGQLNFSTAPAVDPVNEWLYVTDDDNDRLMRFDLSTNPPSYSKQWGCDSSGSTGLRYPTRIAMDNNNHVMYVVDSGNHEIRKLSLYPSISQILHFGSYGTGDGEFKFPFDAVVDSSGNVYVVDDGNRNVQKFDSNGNWLATWPVDFDPLVSLYGPMGISIDSSGDVYVVDAGTRKVYKLDHSGNEVSSWSVPSYSTSIALDEKDGFIYVSTFSGSSYIRQYTMSGTSTGKTIGDGILMPPYQVTMDPGGNLYVADYFYCQIRKFDASGNLLTSVGSGPRTGQGYLDYPYGVALDSSGYMYVADTNNHRIDVFKPATFSVFSDVTGQGALTCTAVSGGSSTCTITPMGSYLYSLTDNGNPVTLPLPGDAYTVSNITSNHTIAATFQSYSPNAKRISGSKTYYSTTLSGVYSGAKDGDIIELTASAFNESPNFDGGVSITLKGGYDPSWASQVGNSAVNGPLTVGLGSVTFDRLVVK